MTDATLTIAKSTVSRNQYFTNVWLALSRVQGIRGQGIYEKTLDVSAKKEVSNKTIKFAKIFSFMR